jgi:hypothetical protein
MLPFLQRMFVKTNPRGKTFPERFLGQNWAVEISARTQVLAKWQLDAGSRRICTCLK